jgi:hypothetical protein
MSHALSTYKTKPHQLQDDLESFFHLMMYHTLRYTPCEHVTGEALESAFRDLYTAVRTHGINKRGLFDGTRGRAVFDGDFCYSSNLPLEKWILTAMDYFAEWLPCKAANVNPRRATVQGWQPAELWEISEDIRLHNHKALADLWADCLTDAAWKDVKDSGSKDRLPKMYGRKTTNNKAPDAGRTALVPLQTLGKRKVDSIQERPAESHPEERPTKVTRSISSVPGSVASASSLDNSAQNRPSYPRTRSQVHASNSAPRSVPAPPSRTSRKRTTSRER